MDDYYIEIDSNGLWLMYAADDSGTEIVEYLGSVVNAWDIFNYISNHIRLREK